MRLFISLLRKEWLDSIRDKRAFTAGMMIAILGPAMFAGMLLMAIDRSQTEEPINVTIKGGEHFPSLVSALERSSIYTEDEEALDSGITLIIDEDFAANVNKSEPALITIQADYAEKPTKRRVQKIKAVLGSFSNQLVSFRLIVRGISPTISTPIKLVEQDSSTAQSRAGFFLTLMSMMVLASVFVASTNVAIDCSAGERERNSLEFLLAQPVKTLTLVMAKTVNTSFFSMVGAALTLVLMMVVLKLVPMHLVGVDINFTPVMAVIVFLVMVPLAALAATLQLVTSFVSKTFKEAQSYLNMTILVPVMLPMILTSSDVEHPVLAWLPITGQTKLISDFVTGADINVLAMLVSAGGALAISAIFVAIIARGLKTEKMILGL